MGGRRAGRVVGQNSRSCPLRLGSAGLKPHSKLLFRVQSILIALLVCCSPWVGCTESSGGSSSETPATAEPDTAEPNTAEPNTEEPDTADSGFDSLDATAEPADVTDADTETPPWYVGCAEPDPLTEGLDKPFPPGHSVPSYASFDCTGASARLPDRVSQVPLDCVIDPDCHEPMVVGHRGVGGEFGAIAPENSLAAIRAAIRVGLDGIELDVRVTADEHVVLMHDGDVDRTTFGRGPISEMTLETAQALQLRPPPLGEGGDFACEGVPTLAEALELTRDRLFVDVDLKTSRVDLVVAEIAKANAFDSAFVSTGNINRALEARRLDSRIRVQVRPDTVADVEAVLAAFDPPADIVEIEVVVIDEVLPLLAPTSSKVFANSWNNDFLYYVTEKPCAYGVLYDAGVHILQSELPHLLAEALGRPPDD